MKFVISNKATLDTFLAIFQLLKHWGTTIECKFTAQGMSILMLSQSKNCYTNILLPPTWFQTYEYAHTADFTNLALDAATFVGVLSNAASKYTSMEAIHVEKEDILRIHLSNESEEKEDADKVKVDAATPSINVYYELPLVQMEEEEALTIPDMEYDVGFCMNAKHFSELTHNLSGFGDTIHIRCDDDSIGLRSSNESGTMRLAIPIDMVDMFEGIDGQVVDMGFKLSILNKLCLSCKIAEIIHIRITVDMPITFRYELEEGGLIEIFAAPVIVEE